MYGSKTWLTQESQNGTRDTTGAEWTSTRSTIIIRDTYLRTEGECHKSSQTRMNLRSARKIVPPRWTEMRLLMKTFGQRIVPYLNSWASGPHTWEQVFKASIGIWIYVPLVMGIESSHFPFRLSIGWDNGILSFLVATPNIGVAQVILADVIGKITYGWYHVRGEPNVRILELRGPKQGWYPTDPPENLYQELL
jgi:hypothetical protein